MKIQIPRGEENRKTRGEEVRKIKECGKYIFKLYFNRNNYANRKPLRNI